MANWLHPILDHDTAPKKTKVVPPAVKLELITHVLELTLLSISFPSPSRCRVYLSCALGLSSKPWSACDRCISHTIIKPTQRVESAGTASNPDAVREWINRPIRLKSIAWGKNRLAADDGLNSHTTQAFCREEQLPHHNPYLCIHKQGWPRRK